MTAGDSMRPCFRIVRRCKRDARNFGTLYCTSNGHRNVITCVRIKSSNKYVIYIEMLFTDVYIKCNANVCFVAVSHQYPAVILCWPIHLVMPKNVYFQCIQQYLLDKNIPHNIQFNLENKTTGAQPQ